MYISIKILLIEIFYGEMAIFKNIGLSIAEQYRVVAFVNFSLFLFFGKQTPFPVYTHWL